MNRPRGKRSATVAPRGVSAPDAGGRHPCCGHGQPWVQPLTEQQTADLAAHYARLVGPCHNSTERRRS